MFNGRYATSIGTDTGGQGRIKYVIKTGINHRILRQIRPHKLNPRTARSGLDINFYFFA